MPGAIDQTSQIGQLAISLAGTTLLPTERTLIAHAKVGMVILYKENWDKELAKSNPSAAKSMLVRLINSIREINPHILIGIHHEGGKMWCFHEGFTTIPSAQNCGEIYNTNQNMGQELAFRNGRAMAKDLLEIGINFSFAPVLDIYQADNTTIENCTRSFHHDPKMIAILAESFIKGMHAAGMLAIAKHFPGYGYDLEDAQSHLSVDNRSQKAIQQSAYPFFELINKKLLDGIITAQVYYPQLDAQNVATFSREILDNFFQANVKPFSAQERICFFSDDLGMQQPHPATLLKRLTDAHNAGCDFLMCTHQHGALLAALGEIIEDIPDTAVSSYRREQLATKAWFQMERKSSTIYPPHMIQSSVPPVVHSGAAKTIILQSPPFAIPEFETATDTTTTAASSTVVPNPSTPRAHAPKK